MNEKKILLLGAYGRQNIGDDLYLKIFLDRFTNNEVHLNCWKTSNLPKEVTLGQNHIVRPTSASGFPGVMLSLLKCDAVVYGGGELWMKLEGTAVPDYSTYKMLFINIVARAFRKRIYYVSVGAEPLAGWSRTIASWSAKLATKVYLRDHESASTLRLPRKKYKVVPDIAYLLKVPESSELKRKNYVTVSLSKSVAPRYKAAVADHITSLARVINKHFPKTTIVALSAMSDLEAKERDQTAVDKFTSLLDSKHVAYEYKSIHEFVEQLAQSKLTISYRLHVSILAHLVGTPVIGIGYMPKVKKYFKSYSSINAFCPVEELGGTFEKAYTDIKMISRTQKKRTAEITIEAEEVYKEVFTNILEK